MNPTNITLFISVILIILYIFLIGCIYLVDKIFRLNFKKPYPIIAECVLLAFGIAGDVSRVVTSHLSIPNLGLHLILGIVSIYGLWKMKKWGIVTAFLTLTVAQLIPIQQVSWAPFSLIMFLPTIVILLYYKQFK